MSINTITELRQKLELVANAVRGRTGEHIDMTIDEIIDIIATLPMRDLFVTVSQDGFKPITVDNKIIVTNMKGEVSADALTPTETIFSETISTFTMSNRAVNLIGYSDTISIVTE